jgi:hypothetical protein
MDKLMKKLKLLHHQVEGEWNIGELQKITFFQSTW